jgi:hypothetical protein
VRLALPRPHYVVPLPLFQKDFGVDGILLDFDVQRLLIPHLDGVGLSVATWEVRQEFSVSDTKD